MQEREYPATLVNRYLCGEIADEERRELDRLLAGSPGNAEVFIQDVRMHRLLESRSAEPSREPREVVADILAGEARHRASQVKDRIVRQEQATGRRSDARAVRRTPSMKRWMSIAACLAIIAGVLVYNHRRSTQSEGILIAHIKATAPNVRIIRRGKVTIAEIDMGILPGDRIQARDDQRATFVYEGEETKILIHENTTLDIGGVENGKRLDLESGVIDASVDPQPEGAPMVVVTPHAEAVVRGTAFRLHVGPGASSTALPAGSGAGAAGGEATRIDVSEGLVSFTGLSAGKSVDVTAGHYAVAAEGVEPVALAVPASVFPAGIPSPATHLYGKVLFEDDFDEGIDTWEVVAFGVNPDPEFKDVLSIIDDGAEHLWAMEKDYRSGKKDTTGVSCVMIHPNVEDMVKQDKAFETTMAGLMSKETIAAERFVVELRYCLAHKRRGPVEIGTSLLNVTKTLDSRRNPKAGRLGTGWQILRCEFRPAKGHPENVLLRHFFSGPRGDRYFNSSLVLVAAKQVVFAVGNATIAVDRVTVREILEDPEEEGGAR